MQETRCTTAKKKARLSSTIKARYNNDPLANMDVGDDKSVNLDVLFATSYVLSSVSMLHIWNKCRHGFICRREIETAAEEIMNYSIVATLPFNVCCNV